MNFLIQLVLLLATLLAGAARAGAAMWSEPIRGSWVSGDNADAAITLVDGDTVCDIVTAENEGTIVRQAATFLAGDIEKISGRKPAIVSHPREGHVVIVLTTANNGEWESFKIQSGHDRVSLVGSNPRGTAFAAYTLSERLGIDPLYHWTGYPPEHHNPLRTKPIDYSSGPPTFKYRGMFHDDEDILPRPFDDEGRPLVTGDVPTDWYAKYFETALRLRMNMVAPYTRVHRRYEVQKLASDWGLFYTSHHYDILLSNPFGITRFGLGAARGSGADYNWFTNHDGILRYWRGGVEENKDLDCVWPVGMRGTDDTSYKFPPDMSEDQKTRVFNEVIHQQVEMVKHAVGPDRPPPVFHFTLYHEMLEKYRAGAFDMPQEVILVWTDDDDGTMRDLPRGKDKWKHGVYYHLAYLGKQVKQNAHIVPPQRVAEQFRKIVNSGATEYMLVNVSELREFVMEARMLADICWDAKATLGAGDDPAKRYVDWWCREYFPEAPADAAEAYAAYCRLLESYDKLSFGSEQVHRALAKQPLSPQLDARAAQFAAEMPKVEAALSKLHWPTNQFFFENVVLPLRFDERPTAAAGMLRTGDTDGAMAELEKLETETLRAERPPFEGWYRHTWIRRATKPMNVHRPYEELRLFLSTGGREFELNDPPTPRATTRAAATTRAIDR